MYSNDLLLSSEKVFDIISAFVNKDEQKTYWKRALDHFKKNKSQDKWNLAELEKEIASVKANGESPLEIKTMPKVKVFPTLDQPQSLNKKEFDLWKKRFVFKFFRFN